MSSRNEHPAVTLIELLIVFAMIALLIGLLIPAIGFAREKASRQICRGNLRQISAAVLMYGQENADRLPEASWMPSVSPAPLPTKRPIFLADVLLPFLGGQAAVFRCPADRPGRNQRPSPVPRGWNRRGSDDSSIPIKPVSGKPPGPPAPA